MENHKQAERPVVLIVEDDSTNAEVLSLIIAQETGCHPLVVPSADQALKIVQHIKPILFILDYHLPGIDGIQLYKQLRTMAGLDVVPTIFISASKIESQTEPLNVAFIEKPFELDTFVETVQTLLPAPGLQTSTPQTED